MFCYGQSPILLESQVSLVVQANWVYHPAQHAARNYETASIAKKKSFLENKELEGGLVWVQTSQFFSF